LNIIEKAENLVAEKKRKQEQIAYFKGHPEEKPTTKKRMPNPPIPATETTPKKGKNTKKPRGINRTSYFAIFEDTIYNNTTASRANRAEMKFAA